MSNYNLSALDDKEFEALAVDLIGMATGKRIERFKPGTDMGVDGRWFISQDHEAVIQCKHWCRSGYNKLARYMIRCEKPKIDRLTPARYILVTSVELSRRNKQYLRKQLAPHVLSDSDIYGSEDIHDLLARHPEIERRHYKLWLTSVSVLGHIFNNAILGRSHFDSSRIQVQMPRFVKTGDFDKAARLLSRRRVIIITGDPGIGKTTLADQLLIRLIAKGFEMVKLAEDVSEAESVYATKKKQVFYFDDFLGRNILEALTPHYDSHIISFINRVHNDKSKRFILTSRTNILNQAKRLTDLFGLEKVDKSEYEMRITDLHRLDKARILYSHIWHSNLSADTLDELFKENRYKVVIDHPNYNPRLVAFVTDHERADQNRASDYWGYVTNTLNNPRDIWDYLFTSQLSQECRDLVYLVILNGQSIAEKVLLKAFRYTRSAIPGMEGKVEHAAMGALKICVGSVFNRQLDARTGNVIYELYNPSLADYVFGTVKEWSVYWRYFLALRTAVSLRVLAQMRRADIILYWFNVKWNFEC